MITTKTKEAFAKLDSYRQSFIGGGDQGPVDYWTVVAAKEASVPCASVLKEQYIAGQSLPVPEWVLEARAR